MTITLPTISPDGSVDTCSTDYDSLSAAVGGYIEFVRLPAERDAVERDEIIINDSSVIEGHIFNPVASLITQRPIFGTIILCATNTAGDTGRPSEEFSAFALGLADLWRGIVVAGWSDYNIDLRALVPRDGGAASPPVSVIGFDPDKSFAENMADVADAELERARAAAREMYGS